VGGFFMVTSVLEWKGVMAMLDEHKPALRTQMDKLALSGS
jgi:hypothetical protein